MKIAYVVLKGMPLGGGIEKYTEEVGSRLAARGHHVNVYTMRHYGASDGVYKGMRIKTVPTVRRRSFEKMTAMLMAALKSSAARDADIVHFHAFGPSVLCFIPKLLGKKVVVQGHGLEWKRSRWSKAGQFFLKVTEAPSIRIPDALTVVSKVQQKYIRDKYKRESIYIPTGVNAPRITSPDLIKTYGLMGNDYILFAARLVREKGAHYLIEAFNRLTTDVRLVIAGDAQHEEAYKAYLLKLAKGNSNIIFTGFATGKLLDELFSNACLFVLPSETEGLPTALLEAMSYGNCCLVSDIPENMEALSNIGYTFRNKDVDDLSKKLAWLLLNRDTMNALREKAKAHVLSNYSWSGIAAQFEDFYKSLF